MNSTQHNAIALIYRDLLLPYSETWIVDQAEGLKGYLPFYVGTRRTRGIELPKERRELVSITDLLQSHPPPLSFDPLPTLRTLRRRMGAIGRPSLINAHFGYDAVNALSLGRHLQLPVIVTYHGYDACLSDEALRNGTEYQRRYLFWRTVVFQRAERVLASSEFLRTRLVQQGCPEDKIVRHYIGIDLSRFPEPTPREARESFVLFVGRLTEKKGCRDLITAMRIVQDSFPLLRLVIVGDGSDREDLVALARSLNVNASFLGAKPPAEVLALMQRALLFCVPSVTARNGDAEGLGMVFLEAQASGLPVIATASGGIPEAVSDGRTGLLSPERNPEKLAHNIRTLASDAVMYQNFQRAGVDLVHKSFNLAHQNSLLELIYGQVSDHSPCRRALLAAGML